MIQDNEEYHEDEVDNDTKSVVYGVIGAVLIVVTFVASAIYFMYNY